MLDSISDQGMKPLKDDFENSLGETITKLETRDDGSVVEIVDKKKVIEEIKKQLIMAEKIYYSNEELKNNETLKKLFDKLKEKIIEKELEVGD